MEGGSHLGSSSLAATGEAPASTGPAAATSPSGKQPAAKRQRRTSGNEWLRSWAWKREHRPDKVRFDRPYLHPMRLPGGEEVKLTVHQARFKEQGFASTVWDSSIVLAKLFERQAATVVGKRCLDLSAGCGLPGLVLAKLGAGTVLATDLAPNLPLLRKNADANGCAVQVVEHRWGEDVGSLGPCFDVIAACDVMYVAEAVEPLVASLRALSGPHTRILISHGRNRQAEPQFIAAAAPYFHIEPVPSEELDEVYQCADVDVLLLTLKSAKEAEQGERRHGRMDRRRRLEEGEARAAKRLSAPPPQAAGLPPAAPRALRPHNHQLPDPLQRGRLLQPQPPGMAYGLWRQLGTAPLPLPPRPPAALPPSPGWPACSPEKSKQVSEDATSPWVAAGMHILAADIREASTSGRVSRSVEGALFLSAGAGGAAVNPSLATRNRKTELDLEEPSAAVRRLVQAFEALLPPLAAAQGAALMQEAWTALLGCALTGAPMAGQLAARVLHQPASGGERLAQARRALTDCAAQADAVLAGLHTDDAALAALEAMQRVAVRLSLPFYSTNGALHVFNWLEHALWAHLPSLRPAGLAGKPDQAAYQPAASGTVTNGLAHLCAIHEALEDATGGQPEAAREAAAVGVLAAAGAVVMGAHMRPRDAEELLALRCLQPLMPAEAGTVRRLVCGLLQALVPLAADARKLGAAAELLERGARTMRLPADGWARAMWAVLRALRP